MSVWLLPASSDPAVELEQHGKYTAVERKVPSRLLVRVPRALRTYSFAQEAQLRCLVGGPEH